MNSTAYKYALAIIYASFTLVMGLFIYEKFVPSDVSHLAAKIAGIGWLAAWIIEFVFLILPLTLVATNIIPIWSPSERYVALKSALGSYTSFNRTVSSLMYVAMIFVMIWNDHTIMAVILSVFTALTRLCMSNMQKACDQFYETTIAMN